MAPIDIHKLTAATPISPLRGGDSRPGPSAGQSPAPRRAGPAPQGGVAVEVATPGAAGPPPVDAERVREIREALRDGSYPIVPAKIADGLIAARLMLEIAR